MFLASGTPFWAPKDCENITNAASASGGGSASAGAGGASGSAGASGGSASAGTVWSDKEKEVLATLGQGQHNNNSSGAASAMSAGASGGATVSVIGGGSGVSGPWPLSPLSLRALADKSETLRSFGFLKTPPGTQSPPSSSSSSSYSSSSKSSSSLSSSGGSLVDWYSGLAPMGQSVHAIEVKHTHYKHHIHYTHHGGS